MERHPRMLPCLLKIKCGRQHTNLTILVHIFLFYGETGNLGSNTNLSRPNPPARAGTHYNTYVGEPYIPIEKHAKIKEV